MPNPVNNNQKSAPKSPAFAPEDIIFLKLRCDHCRKSTEHVLSWNSTELHCQHCRYRYVKIDGTWYDEQVEKMRARVQ